MSEYNRTTRECFVSQLDPEVRQAFRKYFQEHQLGDLEVETLRCCETISRKKNLGGLFSWLYGSVDSTVHTGILLTSQWLIWARRGDKSGTRLTAANLSHISVREHSSFLPTIRVWKSSAISRAPIARYADILEWAQNWLHRSFVMGSSKPSPG